MIRKITLHLLIFSFSFTLLGQTFDFNGSDGGWTGIQGTLSQNSTSVTLSFEIEKAPKLRHLTAGIKNRETNGIIGITLKNNSGVSELRFQYQNLIDGGTSGPIISISSNDTEFKTYYFDLSTEAKWDNNGTGGIQNELDFQFREPGGANLSNNTDAPGSIEIDQIAFLSAIPRVEKNIYEFNTIGFDEGWSDLIDATSTINNGQLILTPNGGAIAKVTNSTNSVNADNNGLVHIVYKNESSTNNQIRFQFRSNFDNYSAFIGQNASINQNMSNFDTITIELELNKPDEWSGLAQDFQIAVRNTNDVNNYANSDGDFIIDRIVFSNSQTLSIKKEQLAKFTVYPNPTKTFIFIEGEIDIANVEIFNFQGLKILDKKKLKNNILDLSGLSSGLYTVKIEDVNKNFVVKKILVQN